MSIKIYVGNLPITITRQELLNHFAEFKHVISSVTWGIDHDGMFQCYCYLSVEESELALNICTQYHQSELNNCQLRVAVSLQRYKQHEHFVLAPTELISAIGI